MYYNEYGIFQDTEIKFTRVRVMTSGSVRVDILGTTELANNE